jgi:hypothetical protein
VNFVLSVFNRCELLCPDDTSRRDFFNGSDLMTNKACSSLQLLTEGRATVDTNQVAKATQIKLF